MCDLTDSEIAKPSIGTSKTDSVLVKTVRLMINLLTHLLMCLTVFVSLIYACSSSKMSVFKLHILLCALGYQFFMCQGILVLSRFNSWSMLIKRCHKKRLHMLFQAMGFILIVVGSGLMMNHESSHFNSTHGCLGILSLVASVVSVLNGIPAAYAYKLSKAYILIIKCIHYLTGIFTILLSAAALSTGFEMEAFRLFVDDDAVTGLICITWVFSLLVALDFWLLSGQRLKNIC